MQKTVTLNFKASHYSLIRSLLILFISLISFSFFAQNTSNLKFERLSVEQGLSNVVVNCIFQDQQGYMWIGTGVGLNRYDGNTFQIFNNHPNDPASLSHDMVLSVFEGKNGTLWIGTSEGLDSFDPLTETFTKHFFQNEETELETFNNVHAIFQDQSGRLWIGTHQGLFYLNEVSGNFEKMTDVPVLTIYEDPQSQLWMGTYQGLAKYNDTAKTLQFYQHDPKNPESLSHDIVTAITSDSQGRFWVGTAKGLNLFDLDTGQFTVFFHDPNDPQSLSDNQVSSILEDLNGNLWIGTGTEGQLAKNGGLNRFIPPQAGKEETKGTFERFFHDPNQAESLSDNIIRAIFQDRQGILWFATYGNGVNRIALQTRQFDHHFNDLNSPNCLSSNTVWSICEDRQGILWIGTANGLNRYDPITNTYTHYFHDPNDPKTIGKGSVLSVFEDRDGQLWAGVGNGLSRFDAAGNQFFHYRFNPDNTNSLLPGTVRTIYEDENGLLWFGSIAGMTSYDKKSGTFQRYRHEENENSLSNNGVFSIAGGENGTLWIGTSWGLNHFDPKKEGIQFQRFYRENDRENSLSSSRVSCVLADQSGTVWIGTWGGGVNRVDPEINQFKSYEEEDGLPSDWVWGILEDDRGNLWVSTSRGLSKFHPDSEHFRNYDTYDGLQSYEFNQGAYHKSVSSAKMYFGGVRGFNAFHPDSLQNNPYVPPIVFSSFKYYQKGDAEGKAHSVKGVNKLDKLVLGYNQNSFTCEFSALNFQHSFKNQYAYKIRGIHDNWINIGTRNEVTFANLSPGNYTLQIIGSNNNGIWNKEGTSLNIVVKPPFWLTIWAKILYGLIILGIAYYFWRLQVQKQQRKLKAEQEKLEQEKRINEQLRKVDQLKDQFLANTSHELRSPLNGIIGLARSLKEGIAGKMSEKALENLNLIIYSGKRLANLVNDILDFSQLRNGELVLKQKPVDLYAVVETVLALSRPLLNGKPIELINDVSPHVPFIKADENRLQQILHNLVGNGIKFTQEGFVKVTAKIDGNQLAITVSDTGIGFPDSQMESIFNAFQQGDGGLAREYEGTGLGLSVAKQIVELHGGSIQVQSGHGIGAHFTFTIPLLEAKDHPEAKKTTVDEDKISSLITEPLPLISGSNGTNPYPILGGAGYEAMKILIVDDDPVNRQVLENFLFMEGYQVDQATSGKEVLEMLNAGKHFDLIILDVMMPGMSGYTVCEKIRETHPQSELPVIMLTAKNRVTDLVEGFNVGANDFLTKPFSKEELISRIKTHLNLKRIQKATNRFVPHKFLQSIGQESITEVRLGDQANCHVTVFFSDIRDYTTLSEEMTPEENFKFVNAYVGRMGPIIQKHHGFVNQYLGDAIMANFPADAVCALQAAVDMQKTLRIYNEQRKLRNRKTVKVGMGLHTGSLIMGIIGDENRTEPATIANTVNIASRMESLTKYYGANILLSENTKRKIPEDANFHFRYLGRVQLKGKKDLVGIYECFDGDRPKLIDFKKAILPQFNKGLDSFFNKDFEKSTYIFKTILTANQADLVCRTFYERSLKYAENGVSETWDGVEMVNKHGII